MSLFTLYASVKARLLTRSRAVQALLLICILGGLASATAYAQSGPVCTTYTTKTTGNGLGSNVVNAVFALTATAPASNTIYAATDNGLSISTDGGNTFFNKTKVANGLSDDRVTSVYVLKGTSSGSTTIYAATDAGISISTDGGTTFTTRLNISDLTRLFALPATTTPGSATIYGASYGNGIYISTDGGNNFVQKGTSNGLVSLHISSIYVLPAATTPGSATVYAGGRFGDSAFNISTDGGNSFVQKGETDGFLGGGSVYSSGGTFVLPAATTPGSATVYAGYSRFLNISTDGGNSFSSVEGGTNGLGTGPISGVYAVGRTVYAATGSGLSISTDGGQTFTTYTKAANGLGDDVVNDVIVAGNTIYAATNGGLSSCAAPLQCLVSVLPASQTITSGGSATLTASGATSYTWSNGSTENPLVLTDVTSATTLSVTGTTGACSATASAAISVTATEPPAALSVTSPAIDQPLLVLSTGNCPVTFTGQGWGKRFVITNNSGYVFSTVFRNFSLGSNLTAPGINKPGTYTVTAYGDPGNRPVSYTFSVTGTGCN